MIHASDLPKGRGWSPHIWGLINEAQQITISLLEAVDKVDSGDIESNVELIKKTLSDFGIEVDMDEDNVGPTVTQYTFRPLLIRFSFQLG